MREAFRRDDSHWCIECCEGRSCFLVGRLPDGTQGCRGHISLPSDQKDLPQALFCQSFSCINPDGETKRKIWEIISGLTAGKFRISEVLREVGSRK